MNLSIPDFVKIVIDGILKDISTTSIWLVGSRANGYETEKSDWDILYFSNDEPIPKKRRNDLVDSIHVGPSNTGQTDGNDLVFPFDNWEWKEIDNLNATYLGRKFIDYPDGAKDVSDPIYESRLCNAYCLWRKE